MLSLEWESDVRWMATYDNRTTLPLSNNKHANIVDNKHAKIVEHQIHKLLQAISRTIPSSTTRRSRWWGMSPPPPRTSSLQPPWPNHHHQLEPKLEICRDRQDQRSCKIFPNCVKFWGNSANSLGNYRGIYALNEQFYTVTEQCMYKTGWFDI